MLNVATIGTGFIVDWFLQAVEQNEGIRCVAMYTRTKDHALDLASKYHIDTIYEDVSEMCLDKRIDAIYIASPNSLHYTYARIALQHGKHVICEKPFTSTLQEFDELKDYAKLHHLFLFEAIVTAHMPNYQIIKEQLPKLGTIRMVQCNFSQYSSRYDKFLAKETPNVFNPAFSGGALADINIYNLHFCIGLFGKPNAVHYYPTIQRGIDTSGCAILEYDGFQAICVGAKDSKSHCLAQIQGEKGYLFLDSETSRCKSIKIFEDGEEKDISVEQNEDALFYEVKEFTKIYHDQDYDTCYQKLDYSRIVMECYQQARIDGNIVFDADKK